MQEQYCPIGIDNERFPNMEVIYSDRDILIVNQLKNMHDDKHLFKLKVNILYYCINGSIQLDVNNNILTLHASQVLVCHTNMMLKMVKRSEDFDCQILALTDSILETVLNSEYNIWNKAMYLHNLYVFDMTVPGNVDNNYIRGILSQSGTPLHKEILHSLLRTYMLSVCRLFVNSGLLGESEQIEIYNPQELLFQQIPAKSGLKASKETIRQGLRQRIVHFAQISVCNMHLPQREIAFKVDYGIYRGGHQVLPEKYTIKHKGDLPQSGVWQQCFLW